MTQAGGRLLDDFGQYPQQLSKELLALLADAEHRVKSEFLSRPEREESAPDATIALSPELAAALTGPVGEYTPDYHQTSPPRPSSIPPRPLGHSADATEIPTATGWAPPESERARPRSAEPSATTHVDKVDPVPSSRRSDRPFDPLVDRTTKTRPPRTASAAATKRAVTPVPRAPALPKDVWVETTVQRTATELTQLDRSEGSGPHTSRSADPGAFESGDSEFPSGEPGTASTRNPEVISTIPPSQGLMSPALETSGPVTDSPQRSADPTTRPPQRRDTNAPAEPGGPAVTAIKAEPGTASGDTDVVELRPGAAIGTLASAIRRRFTGAIAFESDAGIRRVVLRDGDLVTVSSGIPDESLLHFLVSAGVLGKDVSAQLGHRVPSFGRHAGAALIAGGYLPQDQLWPTLRAHAEFILGRALSQITGVAALETTVPERLRAEPSVFGGATGSEVLVEICRKVVSPDVALERLGGEHVRLRRGEHFRLLEECAIGDDERAALPKLEALDLGDALAAAPGEEFPCVVYALRELGVLVVTRSEPRSDAETRRRVDPLDDAAIRRAVLARRALVDEADYFTLLGVPRSATGYHIRRAYLELKRAFDPSVVLRPGTLELRDDVDVIIDVLQEAYDVLREPVRRERYRRALEASPPGR